MATVESLGHGFLLSNPVKVRGTDPDRFAVESVGVVEFEGRRIDRDACGLKAARSSSLNTLSIGASLPCSKFGRRQRQVSRDQQTITDNDAPVNTLPPQTGTEDTTTPITGLSVLSSASTVTVTLSVTGGTLAGTGFAPASGSAITVTGSPAQVNAALGTVTFTPAANFNGTVTLTMTTSDNGGSGSGGVLTDTDSTTITVAAVNDEARNRGLSANALVKAAATALGGSGGGKDDVA